MEVIKQLKQKSNNCHRTITLVDDYNGEKAFFLNTKRLVDFKTREIVEYNSVYTVETFASLFLLMDDFFNDDVIIANLPDEDINEIKIEYKNPKYYKCR